MTELLVLTPWSYLPMSSGRVRKKSKKILISSIILIRSVLFFSFSGTGWVRLLMGEGRNWRWDTTDSVLSLIHSVAQWCGL